MKYLYQPPFSQQLGIFALPPEKIAREFYNAILQYFKYIDIQFNASNLLPRNLELVEFFARKNYLLLLYADYDTIFSEYSKNTRIYVSKAQKENLNYVEGISMEDYLDFKVKNNPVKFSRDNFRKLKSIIAYIQYKGFGEIAGVYTTQNQLCAAAFFCRWKDRIIYLNAVSSKEGKASWAMFYLMDNFIKNKAGRDLTLDFEGSTIPGIERFFKGFGATPETYYRLTVNNLPGPLKWIKKISK